VETRTSGSEGGPGKRTSRKADTAPRSDPYSRALVGYRWGLSEDTVRLEAAFRAALAARGVPRAVYVDNGSAYISKQLLRACASLGVRLVHSKPGRPPLSGQSCGSIRLGNRCAA